MTKRISRADLVAGRSAFEIRDLFRHIAWYSVTVANIGERLHIDRHSARRLVAKLVDEGYFERDERYKGERGTLWKLTDTAVALARATASPPIHRSTADRLLAGLIERAKLTWEREGFVYRVRRLSAFGSYLRDAPTLGDLDVAVELEPKYSDSEQQWAARMARVNLMRAEARSFGGILAQMEFPRTELFVFLRDRHRALSLIDALDRSDFLADVSQRLVYEHG